MTEWDIIVLVAINLPIAYWLFFHWRRLKKEIQSRHPSKKAPAKELLFWLVGICLVGIWTLGFIDYTRSVSAPLVGLRLLNIWCICFMAIIVWQRRTLKRIAHQSKTESPSRDERSDG